MIKKVDKNTLDSLSKYFKNIIPHDGRILKYIEDQTLEMCTEAVRENPSMINYAKFRTVEMYNMLCDKKS